jgi:hypothetical protein
MEDNKLKKYIYIYMCAGEEGLKGYIVGRKE